MYTVGIDVGGTFTDLVAVDPETNEVLIAKVPSDSEDPTVAIMAGIEELNLESRGIARLIHGTTVATNALLERRGAKTGLVTTEGFRDVIQFNRGRRLSPGGMFDVTFRRPKPLVPRDLRFEVRERIHASGKVLVPLDFESVGKAAKALKDQDVDAVAVCFLHSYAYPRHEIEMLRRLKDYLGPAVFISYSNDVNPQFREFERFSTTVVNAYVGPVVESYLDDLRDYPIPGSQPPKLHIMGSAGGLLDFETAARFPVRTILSGPAGGVTAARHVGQDIGQDNLISCDIGGTSADVALLQNGRMFYAEETSISGVSIRASQLDINTVGAGAGSIIWTDVDGALCVGPQSAGASPGPACYAKGGTEPTITDANVVLNRIGDEAVLGNCIRVVGEMARKALIPIRDRLGLSSLEEAAEGALQILVARTVRAIREISVERGFDPRDFSLVAFGGAGPMHAAAIADGLGMDTVVVPNYPGNFSAFGLLVANIRRDVTIPYYTRGRSVNIEELKSRSREVYESISRQLLQTSGIDDSLRLSSFLAMRLVGQAHEITVPVATDGEELSMTNIQNRFAESYAERYGRDPDQSTDSEILELRASGEITFQRFSRDIWRMGVMKRAEQEHTRLVWFNGRPQRTRIIKRAKIAIGSAVNGPAIVEETGATTVVPPEWVATVHGTGNLILKRR